MKRYMRFLIILTVLTFCVALLFSSCGKEEEPEMRAEESTADDGRIENIEDGIEAMESYISAQAEKASKELEAAVTELMAFISDIDAVDTETFEKAISDFENAIEAAEKAAEDADGEMKSSVERTVEESVKKVADGAKKALETAVAELEATAGDAMEKIVAVEEKLKATDAVIGALNKSLENYYTKTAVDQLLESVSTSLNALIDAIEADKEAWEAATDTVVQALDKISAQKDKIFTEKELYTEDNFNSLTDAYNRAYIIIFRALSAEAATEAMNEFLKLADSVETIPDAIYGILWEAATGGIKLSDKALLDEAKALLDKASEGTSEVLLKSITEYYYDENNFVNLYELYAEYYAAYEKAEIQQLSLNFVEATHNIGRVDLLSWDEIDVALYYYNAWIAKVGSDTGEFTHYVTILNSAKDELARLQGKAKAEYEVAMVDVENVTLYSRQVELAIAWYDEYCSKAGDGIIFKNSTFDGVVFSEETTVAEYISEHPAPEGYKLAENFFVTEGDYNKILQLKKLQDEIREAKVIETAYVIGLIEAIGEVSISPYPEQSKKDEIETARDAYNTWKNGTSEQNRVADGCTVYVIVNYSKLVAAEARLSYLENLGNTVKNNIVTLEFTDSHMDLNSFDYGGAGKVIDAESYQRKLDVVGADIVQFENANGGNRGVISSNEYKAFSGAKLIVQKILALYGTLNDSRVAAEGAVNSLSNVSTTEKSWTVGRLRSSFWNNAKKGIQNAEDQGSLSVALAFEKARFAALTELSAIYDEKISEVNASSELTPAQKTGILGELRTYFKESLVKRLEKAQSVADIDGITDNAGSELEGVIG